MALPSTVTGSWSVHRNMTHGPFLVSGNLYVFTVDTGASKYRAYKSTDNGDTWNEQDSANAPGLSATTAAGSLFVFQVGTTLYVARSNSGASNVIVVQSFASDAWGSSSSTTSAPPVNAVVGGLHISGSQPWYLAVRSGGDYVLFYQSNTESVMGTARRRFSYKIYSAGAWGTAVQFGTGVADHYDLRAAILGASDRVHAFYTKAASSNTGFHRSLSSSNVLDTENSFSGPGNIDNYDFGLPVAFANGGNTEVAIPYVNSSGATISVNRLNSGANPSHTQTAAGDAGAEFTSSNPGALAVSGTTKYLFYPQSANKDLYRDSDGGSNTWGTDATQEASITCAGVNANLVTSAIGILFDDNGTVKYDAYALTVTTSDVIPHLSRYRQRRVVQRRF